jgi:hypothetical protein
VLPQDKETAHSELEKSKTDVTGLDEFDLCVVRRAFYDFYSTEKEASATAALKKKVHQFTDFNGSLHTL